VTPPRVELQRVSHAFGDRVVLRDVDLRLEPGASLALLGPNGSGKSTLLRLVAGLGRPTRGRVLVDGSVPSEAGPAGRRRVGYVAHRPLVWGGLTPAENLRLYAQLYGVGNGAVDAALDRVGLAGRRDDRTTELSQGLRQRLGIARALLHDPDLLLLDEPHASLDEESAAAVDRLIRDARGTRTLVLATHDRARGAALCSAAASLESGLLRVA
jgi:heme exporter protein A